MKELRKRGAAEFRLPARLMERLADTESPQGIFVSARIPAPRPPRWPEAGLVVALEGVQDPGNLGTLLRSSWAASVDVLLLGEGCADPFSPKALRSGAGAQLRLNLSFPGPGMASQLREMGASGIQTVATLPAAKAVQSSLDFRKPTCLVLGAEGRGLSRGLVEACSRTLRLDYPGKVESLNVAVTGSVLLFEILRQRAAKDQI